MGVEAQPWGDGAYYLKSRLSMMMENMLTGGILVFLLLPCFCVCALPSGSWWGFRSAFWGDLADAQSHYASFHQYAEPVWVYPGAWGGGG